jgi:glycosyltransferase involved in cell wall biosynthesis|tara:strand:+ start:322 stop:1254 length:933 start_codon:yes stop_codon:yes gene_type:complete
MIVSVIIPVYNAEKYVTRAVESVLLQHEVEEVILIEDGSLDNSLIICNSLQEKNDKVNVIRHADGLNHGAGPSRNQGINRAKGEYIAFLDADDYYCDNRFTLTRKVFEKHPEIDGVYEVMGASYNSDYSKSQHIERMRITKKHYQNPIIALENTGMELGILPEDLFNEMILGKKGWVHLNALTIKKEAFIDFELFSDLYLGEDSEFIFRLAHEKVLLSTNNIDPVAIRFVHEDNRIPYSGYHQLLWEYMFNYLRKEKFDKNISRVIVRNYLNNYSEYYYNYPNNPLRKLRKWFNFAFLLIKYPRMLYILL